MSCKWPWASTHVVTGTESVNPRACCEDRHVSKGIRETEQEVLVLGFRTPVSNSHAREVRNLSLIGTEVPSRLSM